MMRFTIPRIISSCRSSQCQRASFSTPSVVTTAMVKELRDKIGAPMMECKKALSMPEVNGDIAKAIDYLRAKGIARASQQTDRVAQEGLIAVCLSDDKSVATMIEINSETDFVSRNKDFQLFVNQVADAANKLPIVGNISIDQILDIGLTTDSKTTVRDLLGEVVSKIRESIIIRRILNVKRLDENSCIAVYVHGKVGAENLPESIQMGRSASLIEASITPALSSQGADAEQQATEMLRRLAMHIVAAKPSFVSVDNVPSDILEKEKTIFREQSAEAANKKPEIFEKIVMGKVNKRLAEICLLGQAHVAEEGGPVVSKYLDDFGKKSKSTVTIKNFELWNLGKH